MAQSQKLSFIEKVGYGSGDLSVNVVISGAFLILNYFYTDVFGLKPADLGLMLLLVRCIDAVTDPTMGLITDHVNTRWGRFRPWFLYLSVPFGLSVFLMFTTPDLDYGGKLAWAYATYTFCILMFTGVTIPYISIIGVMTDNPQERLSANGYRLFLAKVGAYLVSVVAPILAVRWGAENLQRGWQLALGLMGALSTVLFLFCFLTTKERIEYQPDRKPLWEQFRLLLRNDQWLVLVLVCLLGTIGYTMRGAVGAYYAKYYLGSAELVPWFVGTGVTASIVSMVASTWITKRYCKVRLFRWSQVAILPLAAAMYFLVRPGDVVSGFVFYFVIGFVVDLQAPIFWSAVAEVVDYGHAKTGKRVSGLSFGGISFAQKLGMGLAALMMNSLLAWVGFKANEVQSAVSADGIAIMLTVGSAVFHLGMGLLMFKYRITDAFYNRLKEGKVEGLQPIPGLVHDTTV